MAKRTICLLLALVMMLSLALTSCSGDDEKETEETDAARQNIVLTIYAVTDKASTEEGIAAVEQALSEYCVAKYKTAIDLRLYTPDEYEAALDDMNAKFAEQDEAKKQAEAEAKAAAKAEKEKLSKMSVEEKRAYEQQKRLDAAKKAEEEAERLKAEKELIEEGKDVATVKEIQMDILYIDGEDMYKKAVENNWLLKLNDYLTGRYKKITDYVYPAFLYGASVNGSQYAIPVNRAVADDETYLIVNTKLAEKYGFEVTAGMSLYDIADVLEKVKNGESGIDVISGDFLPEGMQFVSIDGEYLEGSIACVHGDIRVGQKFTCVDMNSTFSPFTEYGDAFIKWCGVRADYREKGYLGADDSKNFFLGVKKIGLAEKAEYEASGYTVVPYIGAEFTTEDVFGGMFGVSSRCEYPARAMEILRLMYTDDGFHNLFTYGVEGENYVVNSDGNTISMLKNDYTMDFYGTGNTFLGYVPENIPATYVKDGMAKNMNSRISPFFNLTVDPEDEDAKKDYDYVKETIRYYIDENAEKFEKLKYGDSDYMNTLQSIYDDVTGGGHYQYSVISTSAYRQAFQQNCTTLLKWYESTF